MIDAWLSSSEHDQRVGPGEGGEHAEVGGEAGGEQHRGLGALPRRRARASSSWCTGREPTMSRAAPRPVPQRSSASCAAATTAGCWVRPR